MDDENERLYQVWLAGFHAGTEKALQCAVSGLATGRAIEQIYGEVTMANGELVSVMLAAGAASTQNAPEVA